MVGPLPGELPQIDSNSTHEDYIPYAESGEGFLPNVVAQSYSPTADAMVALFYHPNDAQYNIGLFGPISKRLQTLEEARMVPSVVAAGLSLYPGGNEILEFMENHGTIRPEDLEEFNAIRNNLLVQVNDLAIEGLPITLSGGPKDVETQGNPMEYLKVGVKENPVMQFITDWQTRHGGVNYNVANNVMAKLFVPVILKLTTGKEMRSKRSLQAAFEDITKVAEQFTQR